MKLTIEMRIEERASLPLTVPIHAIDRTCDHVQDVGLKLVEAKAILEGIQQMVVREQLARYLVEHRACPDCGRVRTIKGYQSLRFRTAFGDVPVRSPRWCRCRCETPRSITFSPLTEILMTHTAPELEYLEAKWAAKGSFSAVAELLHDVLPIDRSLGPETVRQHVLATAQRLEAQLEWTATLILAGALTHQICYPS